MKCPECAAIDDRVIDSRLAKDNTAIRRRRECLVCKHRFTTYETVEESLPLVVKKDERRESFDRKKIIEGMRRACEKRPVTFKQIESVAEAIEQELIEKGDKEVAARNIGDRVMDELRRIDEVAYVRFASVYRSFRDIEEFITEIKELSERKESQLQAFAKNGPRDEGQGIQDSP